ncbi:MAG TPA: hypothetical protein VGM25_00115 [Caulobacteraceae bacterium]|jgi:hypothetical protein
MRGLPLLGLACALALTVAAPAFAWDIYTFPEAKFAAQFPGQPQVGAAKWRTTAGLEVPAQRYAIQDGGVAYSVTLADFSGTALDKDAVIADGVKAFGAEGEVLVDVEARINSEYGREMSVKRKDGGHDIVAIFFFDNHLYVLNGRAAAPNPTAATANLIRFQQSLNFMH